MWSSRKKKQINDSRQAFDFALKKLGYRDYSEAALRQVLLKAECPPEALAECLRKLQDYGFLNDQRYADRLYADWLAKKVYGRRHLLFALQKKQLPEGEIQRILAQYPAEEEDKRAEEAALVWCRMHGRKAEDRETAMPKLARALAARGFDINSIGKILTRFK